MGPVVRLEGLPFRVSKEELKDFFNDCKLANDLDSIHIILNHDGRASGLGYVELATEDDVEPAIKMSNQNIASHNRYAKVVECKMEELQWYLNRKEASKSKTYRVNMSGLPFRATEYDIATWFGPEAKCSDVEIHLNRDHRPSGEATAFFNTEVEMDEAMRKDQEEMQGRYINLTKNSSGPLSRTGYFVKMSGLPYRTTEQEIKDFFGPVADCISARIIQNREGRSSGDAIAEFETEDDVKAALTKDRQHIGSRFIILTAADGSGPSNNKNIRVGEFSIRMGGLPYRATVSEIKEWFSPEAECVHAKILTNRSGRPSGEAIAEFKTEEMAQKAMNKNKEYMGDRFVILTPQY